MIESFGSADCAAAGRPCATMASATNPASARRTGAVILRLLGVARSVIRPLPESMRPMKGRHYGASGAAKEQRGRRDKMKPNSRHVITPSLRSRVAPFIAMDLMNPAFALVRE